MQIKVAVSPLHKTTWMLSEGREPLALVPPRALHVEDTSSKLTVFTSLFSLSNGVHFEQPMHGQ